MKNKKIVLGLSTIAAVAAPIAAVVACGSTAELKDFAYKYTGGKTIANDKVAFITDGGDINDKSFNQSVWEGTGDATASKAKAYTTKQNDSSDVINQYKQAYSDGKKIFVASGFSHQSAIETFAPMKKDLAIVWIDGVFKQKNVASVQFKLGAASFLTGVQAALYASKHGIGGTHRIGYYGGRPVPSVMDYINNFVKGINFYNQNKKATAPKIEIDNGGMVGSWDTAGISATIAANLVSKKDALILPVGGPQYKDVVGAIKASGSKVIGVDVDTKKLVGTSDKDKVWGSILKNLRTVTNEVTSDIMKDTTKHLGKTYTGTLKSGGTGLVIGDQKGDKANKFNFDNTLVTSEMTKTIDQIITEAEKLDI